MPRVRYRSSIPVSAEALFEWHSRPGAFERLVPPWQSVELAYRNGDIHDGDRLAMDIKLGPARVRWVAEHSDYVENQQFRDAQLQGPFKHWVHTHRIHDDGNGQSILDDSIDYDLPVAPWSHRIGGRLAAGEIRRMFRFRHLRTRNDLIRHWKYRTFARLRVGIVGYGRIADQLGVFLTSGDHVLVQEGQANFVIDLTHLRDHTQTRQTDLRPSGGWITVLPRAAPGAETFRWPRHIQIRTPTIVGDQAPGALASLFSTIEEVTIDAGYRDLQHPWIAEDDLIGVIHHVLMAGSSADAITIRAPSLAFEGELRAATGSAPRRDPEDVPPNVFGYRYLYPTLDNALAARSGHYPAN